jgi:sigma-B regulation protein RsbU (phosphoserine phosphatase)
MGSRSIQARTSREPYLVHSSAGARKHAGNGNAQEQLEALRLELAEFHRELFEAAQTQRTMSGPRQLVRGEFEIAAEIFPVRHLSGDFFSITDCGSATVLAIGDIAGKGLRAGIWFTHLLGLTRLYAHSTTDPGEALAKLNHQLCMTQSPPPLTTLFLAKLDWVGHKLTYSNAGHPAPLLLRANTTESLAVGGPVLAAVTGARFESDTVDFLAGDMMVAYSDGLVECSNEDSEEFGIQRLADEARKLKHSVSMSEALFSIIGTAQDFAGTHSRTDDCTVVMVRRN